METLKYLLLATSLVTAVSVDGTWQKRGHCSKTGVVFVMSVDTGEVIDYELKTIFCRECASQKYDNKATSRYTKWEESHKIICDINHDGSSEKMEKVGTTDIFYVRSIKEI